jgi:hypothetical protein
MALPMIERVLSEQAEGALTAACASAPPSAEGHLSEVARDLPLITARWAARMGASGAMRHVD